MEKMDALIYVPFGTGCRIGEALGLRWEDLDFENKTITIIHSLGYVQHNGSREVFLSSPKTEAGKRTIPMVDAVEKMLKNECLKQQQNNITSCTIDGFSGFVFVDKMERFPVIRILTKQSREFQRLIMLMKLSVQNRRKGLLCCFRILPVIISGTRSVQGSVSMKRI